MLLLQRGPRYRLGKRQESWYRQMQSPLYRKCYRDMWRIGHWQQCGSNGLQTRHLLSFASWTGVSARQLDIQQLLLPQRVACIAHICQFNLLELVRGDRRRRLLRILLRHQPFLYHCRSVWRHMLLLYSIHIRIHIRNHLRRYW